MEIITELPLVPGADSDQVNAWETIEQQDKQ